MLIFTDEVSLFVHFLKKIQRLDEHLNSSESRYTDVHGTPRNKCDNIDTISAIMKRQLRLLNGPPLYNW